jgi:uncharacterized membrane protein
LFVRKGESELAFLATGPKRSASNVRDPERPQRENPAKPSFRLDAIDASRGAAMFFVFLAHFVLHYFGPGSQEIVSVRLLTGIASPTFMLISGMVAGYYFALKPDGFDGFAGKLLDRGLFLLIPAHLLIAVSHLYVTRPYGAVSALSSVFITDAIGFAIIAGPLAVSRVRVGLRVLLGVGILAVSWTLTVGVSPDGFGTRLMAEALWGSTDLQIFWNSFPFLPWLAVYLLGTCAGERLGRLIREGGKASAIRFLFRLGIAAVVLAVVTKVGYWWLVNRGSLPSGGLAYQLTTPLQKYPPGPTYVLFYGGAGILMAGVLLWLEQGGWARWIRQELAVLGRASLFLFVLQFFVYYTGFAFLSLPYAPWWPVYFALSVVFLWWSARVWLSLGYNRFITVGVPRLALRHH